MNELCTASNKLLRLVPPLATVDGHMATALVNLNTNAIQRVDLRVLAERDNFEDAFM